MHDNIKIKRVRARRLVGRFAGGLFRITMPLCAVFCFIIYVNSSLKKLLLYLYFDLYNMGQGMLLISIF